MKPKLEFKTNIPEKFIFVKMFKQGESEFQGNKSKWFACEVKHKDIEKTLFASQALWNKMNKVAEGDTIEATLAEIETDDKKKHKEWLVTINGVEQGVSKTKEIVETEEKKIEYHNDKQDKWDEIAWGKCKYGFLLELFEYSVEGGGINFYEKHDRERLIEILNHAEPVLEQWADAATRRLEKPVFNNEGDKYEEPYAGKYEGTPF